MYVYKSMAESRVTNAHHIINSALTGSRSPAGPRRLGTATRISASLFRRLSAFFWSTPGQDPKAAKYAVLTPGPGIFVNVRNAPRVVIPPPSETTPVSPCKPLCAIFLRKPSVYPLSPVKANVSRLCEKLKTRQETVGDKIYGGNFAGFSPSADSESPQRTGKCMYIKRGRTKGISLAAQSRAVAGEGRPLFRRVCRCV